MKTPPGINGWPVCAWWPLAKWLVKLGWWCWWRLNSAIIQDNRKGLEINTKHLWAERWHLFRDGMFLQSRMVSKACLLWRILISIANLSESLLDKWPSPGYFSSWAKSRLKHLACTPYLNNTASYTKGVHAHHLIISEGLDTKRFSDGGRARSWEAARVFLNDARLKPTREHNSISRT